MNKFKNLKSSHARYRSLRSILLIWFTLFSIIPLIFVGWYSVYKFEEAFDLEVTQRLQGNGREIESIISDYYRLMQDQDDRFSKDSLFQTSLISADNILLNNLSVEWINKIQLSSIAFYDKTGKLISSTFKDANGTVKFKEVNSGKIILNEKYLSNLTDKNQIGFVNQDKDYISLILFTKVISNSGKLIGYFEQIIDLKESFLKKIKAKLKIESFIINDNKEPITYSRQEFKKIKINSDSLVNDKLIEFDLDSQSYGFVIYPVSWERSKFYIGLGSVKKDSKAILKNVNIAFVTVVSFVSIFLILTILITTNWFLNPVENLINGFKSFERTEQLIQVPLNNSTEIGLLTEAFNEMSYKIYQTRLDLKKKIKELEKTNTELVEAQTKLVHSAKMTSLGQLVAGVAHELNNPIGFIFSNMSLLKEYTNNLIELIDSVDKKDSLFVEKIKDIDYDFIKNDLPRLIKSCQDGAQRTRDIVLGLRNFSRLEEAQLKEIDMHESINTTLEILQSEIKNRIVIHKNFQPIPKIFCYASQINQVIMNVLSNAIQAIQGNGQIWISTTPIKPGADHVARVQISIQDSGMGMAPEVVEKIFEPFFTTKGVGKGTGLGLSISYGIIQNHGGEIQVRSQKNIGTEFVIIIPVIYKAV